MSEVKPGSLIHVEFATDDPQRTVRFLDEVFGWKFQSIPGLVYHVFTTPTGSGGAVMKASEDQPKASSTTCSPPTSRQISAKSIRRAVRSVSERQRFPTSGGAPSSTSRRAWGLRFISRSNQTAARWLDTGRIPGELPSYELMARFEGRTTRPCPGRGGSGVREAGCEIPRFERGGPAQRFEE